MYMYCTCIFTVYNSKRYYYPKQGRPSLQSDLFLWVLARDRATYSPNLFYPLPAYRPFFSPHPPLRLCLMWHCVFIRTHTLKHRHKMISLPFTSQLSITYVLSVSLSRPASTSLSPSFSLSLTHTFTNAYIEFLQWKERAFRKVMLCVKDTE